MDPNRSRIVPPNLDDRDWKQIFEEARALIPKYAPQWTDHNPSDIGITLLELFAFLVDGLIYRLNRVPEKNYVAFLNLLGITRDPEEPAQAYLSFTPLPSVSSAVTIPKGLRVQTQGTESDPPVVFETDAPLSALPTRMTSVLTLQETATNSNSGAYYSVADRFLAPPGSGYAITVADNQPIMLVMGFSDFNSGEIDLRFLLSRPVGLNPDGTPRVNVAWTYSSNFGPQPFKDWNIPAMTVVADGTLGLRQDGVAQLKPDPNHWVKQRTTDWPGFSPSFNPLTELVSDELYWIGAILTNADANKAPVEVDVDAVLFNAVSATQALTVNGARASASAELLGASDGTAFQIFPLKNHPLWKRPDTDTPYDHLEVRVGMADAGTATVWSAVDDIPAGPGNFFLLNAVTGEIQFGNYDSLKQTGNGTVPPAGANVYAMTYRYVAGGASGNVGAGAVNTLNDKTLGGQVKVVNVRAAFGGADQEPIEDTERRAPQLLRSRGRAVTAEDFELLAQESSTQVAVVRALGPRLNTTPRGTNNPQGGPWVFAAMDRSMSNANVIVVPRLTPAVPRPKPTDALLREVNRYLDQRRDITTRLYVTGPRYLPIVVNVSAFLFKKAQQAISKTDLANQIVAGIEAFLHPVFGGADGDGWQVGQSVVVADLYKAIAPSLDVGYITSLTVQTSNTAPDWPDYHDPSVAWDNNERPVDLPITPSNTRVDVMEYELVCAPAHATLLSTVQVTPET